MPPTAEQRHGAYLFKGAHPPVFRRCGGNLRIIASIEQPELIARILGHLERTAPGQSQPERPLGARAPPMPSALL